MRLLRLSVPATHAGAAAAQDALRHHLTEAGAAAGLVSRAEVVAEEVVLNVADHGEAGPDARVRMKAAVEAGRVSLTFEDDGRAYDPLSAPLPPAPGSLAEAGLGGLGLVLIRRLAAEAHYERLPDGRNRLRLVLALP